LFFSSWMQPTSVHSSFLVSRVWGEAARNEFRQLWLQNLANQQDLPTHHTIGIDRPLLAWRRSATAVFLSMLTFIPP